MKLLWDDRAWNDYIYWQNQDKKTLRRINALVRDIQRDRYNGIGKPSDLLQIFYGHSIFLCIYTLLSTGKPTFL